MLNLHQICWRPKRPKQPTGWAGGTVVHMWPQQLPRRECPNSVRAEEATWTRSETSLRKMKTERLRRHRLTWTLIQLDLTQGGSCGHRDPSPVPSNPKSLFLFFWFGLTVVQLFALFSKTLSNFFIFVRGTYFDQSRTGWKIRTAHFQPKAFTLKSSRKHNVQI